MNMLIKMKLLNIQAFQKKAGKGEQKLRLRGQEGSKQCTSLEGGRKTELLVKILVFHRCLHPYSSLTIFFFNIYSCMRLWKRN